MEKISQRYHNFHAEQYWYAKNFLEDFLNIGAQKGLKILEIGTAEGGLLKYFSEKNHICYGIEISKGRWEISLALNADGKIIFINGDITDSSTYDEFIKDKFDIIVCHDVIEHIPKDRKIMALRNMFNLLSESGRLYISFPPKYSPYAGHQQGAPRILAKIPYIYLLPDKIYRQYLSLIKVSENIIDQLCEIKDDRISITAFERLVSEADLKIKKSEFYVIRPGFEYRFKRMKKHQHKISNYILREIFTLGALYLLSR